MLDRIVMKKCYFCGEEIPDSTIVCPWCGRRDLKAEKSPSRTKTSEGQSSENCPPSKERKRTSGSPLKPQIARALEFIKVQWAVLTVGCLLVPSFLLFLFVIPHHLDASDYSRGHHAYEMADCSVAIENYDRIANRWRIIDIGGYFALAKGEKVECIPFQMAEAKEQAGNLAEAIASYTDFLTNHSASALTTVARDRITLLFAQTKPSALATTKLCIKIDVLIEHDLIPERDTNMPPFYFACGKMREDRKDYSGAIQMYEAFQREYPAHPLAPDVSTALTRAMVAEAKRSGAGEIPAPQRSGRAAVGSTLIAIRNDSPEPIQLVFSGPEPRIEELAACSSCVKYRGAGPSSCPEKGPTARYKLKPGNYDVLVKSTGSSTVIPFTGRWDLSDGVGYSHCFFIVTKRSP